MNEEGLKIKYDSLSSRYPTKPHITEVGMLGNSFVRYVRHSGTDQNITDAARISYLDSSKGEVKDKGLLRYLFRHKHTSPFEMVNITFNIRMPIFVMRQFVRHRTFRLNELSARYTELDIGYYLPDVWRAQDTKNKQGSITSEDLEHSMLSDRVNLHSEECFMLYKNMLKIGVAREMARMVLPLNVLTEIIVNIDISNLIKYFTLRDDNHAQYEIQQISKGMKLITAQKFPWVMEMYEEMREAKA